MAESADGVAEAVLSSVGLLVRRVRQVKTEDDLTLAERAALGRLATHAGPATSAELARAEQISAQSMGVLLAALEDRGLIVRGRDPHDGRRVVYSFTESGLQWRKNNRNARADVLAHALAEHFTSSEVEQLSAAAPLLERLALSI